MYHSGANIYQNRLPRGRMSCRTTNIFLNQNSPLRLFSPEFYYHTDKISPLRVIFFSSLTFTHRVRVWQKSTRRPRPRLLVPVALDNRFCTTVATQSYSVPCVEFIEQCIVSVRLRLRLEPCFSNGRAHKSSPGLTIATKARASKVSPQSDMLRVVFMEQ